VEPSDTGPSPDPTAREAPTPARVLEVSGLVREFGPLRAVNDVSFSLGAGQLMTVFGPNGAGNGEGSKPQIENGWMNRHPVILELWIQALPVGGNKSQLFEGVYISEEQNHQEEGQDSLKDPDHRGHELPVLVSIQIDGEGSKEGEKHGPKQKGPRLPGPETRDLVVGVQGSVGIIGNVLVLKLVLQKCVHQPHAGDDQKAEGHVNASFGTENQITTLLIPAHEAHGHPPEGDG